jgi:hypothetical protein
MYIQAPQSLPLTAIGIEKPLPGEIMKQRKFRSIYPDWTEFFKRKNMRLQAQVPIGKNGRQDKTFRFFEYFEQKTCKSLGFFVYFMETQRILISSGEVQEHYADMRQNALENRRGMIETGHNAKTSRRIC